MGTINRWLDENPPKYYLGINKTRFLEGIIKRWDEGDDIEFLLEYFLDEDVRGYVYWLHQLGKKFDLTLLSEYCHDICCPDVMEDMLRMLEAGDFDYLEKIECCPCGNHNRGER